MKKGKGKWESGSSDDEMFDGNGTWADDGDDYVRGVQVSALVPSPPEVVLMNLDCRIFSTRILISSTLGTARLATRCSRRLKTATSVASTLTMT